LLANIEGTWHPAAQTEIEHRNSRLISKYRPSTHKKGHPKVA